MPRNLALAVLSALVLGQLVVAQQPAPPTPQPGTSPQPPASAQNEAKVDWFARVTAVVGTVTAVVGIVLVVLNFLWDRYKFGLIQQQQKQDKEHQQRQRLEDKEEQRRQREEDKKERELQRVEDRKEREDQRKEKVKVTLHSAISRKGHSLEVRLLNQTDFTIPIKGVSLTFIEPEAYRPSVAVGEVTSAAHFVTPTSVSLPTGSSHSGDLVAQTGWSKSCDLPARKEVAFVIFLVDWPIFDVVCQLPPDKLWIDVRSHAAEIGRINGREVLAHLHTWAKRHTKKPETPTTPPPAARPTAHDEPNGPPTP